MRPNTTALGGAAPTTSGQWRGRVLGTAAAVVLGGLIVAGLSGAGGGAASAAPSAGRCVTSSRGVAVHFTVTDTARLEAGIEKVALSGFDPASCDGQPVEVILSGNRAGDPTSAATELLSTLDSAKDSCTGAALSEPLTINAGAITLSACASTASPEQATYASVHDVTRLQVRVSGQPIPIGGGTAVSAPHGPTANTGGTAQAAGGNAVSAPQTAPAPPQVASTSPISGLLPNTGGPVVWSLLLAVVLIAVGSLLAGLDRRRRREASFAVPGAGEEKGRNRCRSTDALS